MYLNELLELSHKTKKALIKYLKESNLQYERKRDTIIVKGFHLDDFGKADVNYSCCGNAITYVNVSINKANTTLENLKKWCYDFFGNPIRDNTNHKTDSPRITWQKTYLYTPFNDNSVYIIGMRIDGSSSKPKKQLLFFDLNVFLISMIGGLVWGILFFIFFGIGFGHSFLLFKLSMIGGVVFGILMFLALEIIPNFEKAPSEKSKPIHYKKNHIKMLEEYSAHNFPEHLSTLAMYNDTNFMLNRAAKLFVLDDSVHIAYIKKQKIKTMYIPYSEIRGFWSHKQTSYISIFHKDSSWISLSYIQTNHNEITRYIEDKLGFNGDRFLKIQQVIYDCLVDFDPYSYIALGNDPSKFNEDAKYFAKILLLMDKTDYESVKNAIYNAVGEEYDEYYDELVDNIYSILSQSDLLSS